MRGPRAAVVLETLRRAVTMMVFDRRRRLNQLNGRALSSAALAVGLMLIGGSGLLVLVVLGWISAQLGSLAQDGTIPPETFAAVSWWGAVALFTAVAAGVDAEHIRELRTSPDRFLLAHHGVSSGDVLMARLVLPGLLRVGVVSTIAVSMLCPWLIVQTADLRRGLLLGLVLIVALGAGAAAAVLMSAVAARSSWWEPRGIRTAAVSAGSGVVVGVLLLPWINLSSARGQLLLDGPGRLVELLGEAQPAWWRGWLLGDDTTTATGWLLGVSGGLLLLWGGLVWGLVCRVRAAGAAPVVVDEPQVRQGSWRSAVVMGLRCPGSGFLRKDLLSGLRAPRAVRGRITWGAAVGLAMFGAACGGLAAGQREGLQVLTPEVALVGLTLWVAWCADLIVDVSGVEAEREAWSARRLDMPTPAELPVRKATAVAGVLMIIAAPGLLGIAVLASGLSHSTGLLALFGVSLCVLGGHASVWCSVALPHAEARRMVFVERSPLADVLQSVLILGGAAMAAPGVLAGFGGEAFGVGIAGSASSAWEVVGPVLGSSGWGMAGGIALMAVLLVSRRRRRRTSGKDDMLNVQDVEVRFAAEPLLRGVSFSVAPGELVRLAGGNGSGKSTLLRAVAGLERVQAGHIDLGQGVDSVPSLSLVPAEPVLYDWLSLRENLAFAARLHGVDPADGLRRYRELGLDPHLDTLAENASFGTRSKASFVLSTLRRSRWVLLDEPLNGLDRDSVAGLVGQLRRWKVAGVGVLVVAHEPEPLAALIDRVLVIEDGRIRTGDERPQLLSPVLEDTGQGADQL